MLVASRDDGFEKLPMNSAVPFPKSLPFGIGKASKNGRMAGTAAWRAANVGTGVVVVLGSRSRNPSYEKKMKVHLRQNVAGTGVRQARRRNYSAEAPASPGIWHY